MSKDIFKRVEVKYLLSREQYDELMGKLEPYMVQDEYGLSSISSFYYDTPRYNIVRESLEKPVYKEKFRLRSYGEMKEGSKVFLELKKKYKGVVYKRRVSLSFEEAKAYLEDGVYPDTDSQILREIDYFLKFYDTSVKNYVEYNRIALYGKENKEIRITFDSDICAALDCDSLKRPWSLLSFPHNFLSGIFLCTRAFPKIL